MPNLDPTRSLKAKIAAPGLVLAPGIFDMMSLKLADAEGFDALFFSGYWGMASHLGVPDAGIATYRDFVDRIAVMAAATDIPIICDADTGFGGLLNIAHTVKGYEAAGAAAIQLEDQVAPKKCGHVRDKQVCTTDEMITRIKVAVDSRTSDEFLVVARTDAIAVNGLDDAIARGQAYRDAGADVIFVESPQSREDMARICAKIDGPCLINAAHGGKTPMLPADDYAALGYAIALAPATGALTAIHAMAQAYAAVKGGDIPLQNGPDAYSFQAFCDLIGFPDVYAFDEKWGR